MVEITRSFRDVLNKASKSKKAKERIMTAYQDGLNQGMSMQSAKAYALRKYVRRQQAGHDSENNVEEPRPETIERYKEYFSEFDFD